LFSECFTERAFADASQPLVTLSRFRWNTGMSKQPNRSFATHIDFADEFIAAATLVDQSHEELICGSCSNALSQQARSLQPVAVLRIALIAVESARR
jgi:hypothetical protein